MCGMLNIEFAYPDVKKKHFHTNYMDIGQKVDQIIQYQKDTGITGVLIQDVSFSDNKDSLRKLYENGKVILIDHHMYPEGFFDEFVNMVVVHDKTKSATKLCNEYFKCSGKNRNLDILTKLVDIYDLWQKDKPEFALSQSINEYFWYKIKTENLTLEQLMYKFIESGWSLPGDYKVVVDKINDDIKQKLEEYEKHHLIQRAADISFMFIDDHFNAAMLKEHDSGKNFVVGINSYGIVRVRINQEYIKEDKELQVKKLNFLRKQLTGSAETGHLQAFTYKTNLKPVEEAKRVVDAIHQMFMFNDAPF